MKFHWGHGIALFYCTFAACMFFALFKSFSFDNSLVVDNYYEEDINYQQIRNQRANSRSLIQSVALHKSDNLRFISFPIGELDGEISGKVQLYRPESQRYDQYYDLQVDGEGKFIIPTQNLLVGRWKVKVKWSCSERDYYDELEFYHAAK
ncbi:MAG: FixH family protein [Bacteroidota bacterium]